MRTFPPKMLSSQSLASRTVSSITLDDARKLVLPGYTLLQQGSRVWFNIICQSQLKAGDH